MKQYPDAGSQVMFPGVKLAKLFYFDKSSIQGNLAVALNCPFSFNNLASIFFFASSTDIDAAVKPILFTQFSQVSRSFA